MARHLGIALALATAVASVHCAGGGPSGTHLATAQGTLANAEATRRPRGAESTVLARIGELFRVVGRAWAQSGVEGVRVSVEGTPFETVTDAGGSFVVRGDFAGVVTLLFQRDADGLVARLAIDMPEGGTVTLRNVTCSGADGACQAEDVDVDEPSDDDVSEPSVEDPSDPPVPSPSEDEESESPSEGGDEEPSVEEPSVEEPSIDEPSLQEPSADVPSGDDEDRREQRGGDDDPDEPSEG
jgi:hypothetical protein